jgi:hypothetical protein
MTGQPFTDPDCSLQGGLQIVDENALYDCLESGEPLEPWMEAYLEHERSGQCSDFCRKEGEWS